MLVMTSPHYYSGADEDVLGDDQTPLRDTPVSFSENYAFCLNAESPTISKNEDATATTDVSAEASKNTANEVPSCSRQTTPEPDRRVLHNEFSQPLVEARSNRTSFHPGEVNQPPSSGALYRATFASGHSLSTIESGHTLEASESSHAPFRPSHSILTSRFSQPPTSAIINPPHSILMTREWNRSFGVGDLAHPLLSSRPSRTVTLADPIELSRDGSSHSGANHSSVVFTNTPVKAPRIKSLIDRQLRKFASETSFATTAETASDSSEQDLAAGRNRVLTVRPSSNNSCNRISTGGTVFGRLIRKRQESDGSGSLGSEATVASASVTPLSRHKMRSRMRRPKSATHMGHGSEFGNHGSSGASATMHSMHSLDSMQLLTFTKDERRPSNIYTMDDDSVHEFEDDNDEYENVTLMYAKHEKIPMKDFGSEVRATMDIDHLLNKSVLLLDLQETSLEEIFAKIIHEMDIQEPEFTSEQVRSVLFTQDAGNQFHILSRTVQSICTTGTIGGSFDYDQTWICALCMLNTVQHRHVAIARLSHPTNLGRTMQDLRFIIIVIAPSRAKGTKTALETTRTFATLFADMDIRQRLVMAQTVDQFRSTLLQAAKELAVDQNQWRERKTSIHLSQAKEQLFGPGRWYPFRGLKEDFCRRIQFYASDYLDGIRGPKTIQKLFSSIVFLYFACILPAIAFGVLNDDNTEGGINVRKVIFAQAIGGIFFAIFGGQPIIILLTTVPLAIYIKVIYKISQELGYDFYAMYACVGLWCQFFLIIYSSTEMCSLMKLATRSAEEMFSLFIAIAFTVESIRAIHTSFQNNYHNCGEDYARLKLAEDSINNLHMNASSIFNSFVDNLTASSIKVQQEFRNPCHRDTSILYMLLMFGTLWLGLFLYNFRKTPYLTRSRREWLADYALPASVLIMSFTGAYCFSDIEKDKFKMRDEMSLLAIANIFSLPWQGYFVCLLLGFSLSFLFFMDQNITSAIVNNPQNKLRKGSAQNLDLFVVAILNCFLSMMGLPWMHGALPHSPLHLRALADVEERVLQGHVHEVIMNVRETRLATLIAHILILISTYTLLPYPLRWIPTSVLHGLFLYMALTSLAGNEMFERLLLLITEQQAYPPTHYIRKVPQRKVHLFTACQLLQLILLCAFGFSPYPFIEMVFPIVCFFFLPIRHTLIPRLIDYKYLDALDGKH